MLARKGLLPDGFLLTRLAEDQNQPSRGRSKSQRARFITKTGSCNVAHKNIREQVPFPSVRHQSCFSLEVSMLTRPTPSHVSFVAVRVVSCRTFSPLWWT